MIDPDAIVLMTGFILIAIVLCTRTYLGFRARVEYQKTVRLVIERGQQLTPEFLERLSEAPKTGGRPGRHRELRIGAVSVALGLSIAAFGYLLGEEDVMRPMIAIGNIPFLIGLALIGLWKFAPRGEEDAR
jgi:Domain of unknown function (DUF6249)